MLMRRPSWRLVASLVTAALLAASCSASPAAVKHPKKTPVSHASALHKNAPHKNKNKVKSITGIYSNGLPITGNSGPGSAVAGASGTANTAGGVVNMDATTTTLPGSPATQPQVRITKTGRVLHRHLIPVISKFRPLASPVGATVIIMGKRLRGATAVAFDGIRATITSNTSTRIKAVVPAGATSGPISVVTAAGSTTVQGYVVT
jgi:hypothetical protein